MRTFVTVATATDKKTGYVFAAGAVRSIGEHECKQYWAYCSPGGIGPCRRDMGGEPRANDNGFDAGGYQPGAIGAGRMEGYNPGRAKLGREDACFREDVSGRHPNRGCSCSVLHEDAHVRNGGV